MRHQFVSIAVCAALGLACGREPAAPPAPSVDPAARRTIQSGALDGFVGRYGSHAWLGVPFAKPPVGERRWRAPEPPAPWTGARAALTHGTRCLQYPVTGFGAPGDPNTPIGEEDCLTLAVWAPRLEPGAVPTGDARLPVMVWIHGGGNTIGDASFYDGGRLAQTQNVVVVALHYRLGPLGWLRHASLRASARDATEASGNFGTLDLIRGLEWVRDNAAAFGGDPGNVTIFGESAGGTNAASMLLSPLAKGLFHRAIVQSGGFDFWGDAKAENASDAAEPGLANSSTELVLRVVAPGVDRAAAKARLASLSPAEVEAALRAKSGAEILRAYTPMPGMGMIDMPTVFADGAVLPRENPLDLLAREGGYNRVPVMLGTTRDEPKLFMIGDPDLVKRWFGIFPRLRDPARYDVEADYSARMWKALGADEPAARLRKTQGPSVFVYRFDWDEEPSVLGADLSKLLGAAHLLEVPFVFGHFDLGPQLNVAFTDDNAPGREALAAAMMSYWAQFAATGDPGRGRDGTLPAWTAWDDSSPESHRTALLDTPEGDGIRMGSEPLTRESVVAAVAIDPRLTTPRDRCRVLRNLATWTSGYTREQYDARAECADFPYDGFPWKDASG